MHDDDFLGRELSDEKIKALAESWRRQLDIGDNASPDIVWSIEAAFSNKLPHSALIPQTEKELPENLALTIYNPSRILVRENVYLAARDGHPRARYILAHEFGHVVLHNEMPKSLKDTNQERITLQNLKNMSIERQADTFAHFFLVPEDIARKFHNLSRIVNECLVSVQFGQEAVRKYGLRQKRKLQPYELEALYAAEREPF